VQVTAGKCTAGKCAGDSGPIHQELSLECSHCPLVTLTPTTQVTLGTALAAAGETQLRVLGLFLALASMTMEAVRLTLLQQLLQASAVTLPPVLLAHTHTYALAHC
jgi:hypothetical protein